MPGARVAKVRIVGLGIALALAVLLLVAREAEAGKYSVAQCGWHLGADANWADTTGGAKFRPDSYCATPATADPFDGAHLKSFTQAGQTVSGTRYARWRWDAPPGTAITRVSGTWWHALHDGIEQRIGGISAAGFSPFASASVTDVTPQNFVAGFSPPASALEDRLLCARAESKWCSLEPGSWSAVRALTITIEDNGPPAAGLGGEITAGGWRRGVQGVGFWGSDGGAGVRYGETSIDGGRVALTEYPCEKSLISGEWRATRMRPCLTGVSGSAAIDTTRFSDGNHALGHCATDFAGNVGCAAPVTVGIDNNPPAHPRTPALAGGEEWRRTDDFDLSWSNPDQGPASPIWGAYWRITGPAGYDTGVRLAPGRNVASLTDRSVPGPGAYTLHLWLRDEAGNDAASTAVDVPLRLDNVAPGLGFEPTPDRDPAADLPDSVAAEVTDAHSGPKSGEIAFRRLGGENWSDLPTKLVPGAAADRARLLASLPRDLGPGTYLFRADAADAAGNTATTTRRVDGTEMALRRVAVPASRERSATHSSRERTRLYARLRWRHRSGTEITVPFGVASILSGRLLNADGAGLADRSLRVVSRPSRGALSRTRVDEVRTGRHGGFRLPLPPGPSRRITVEFAGDEGLEASRRPGIALRVRGAVALRAEPTAVPAGGVVHFSGRVRARGAPLPRRGKLIAIQYYETSARSWRPVLFVRSDRGGRFRARYRFRYLTGAARIRFRAVALAEERWPYATGASPPLTVRVGG
ncbi:MAG TPA: hypothetical protein VH476_06595 [Solirubrobacterales bacterium]